jgi:hypothetical protein
LRRPRRDLDTAPARSTGVKTAVVVAMTLAAAFVAGCGDDDGQRSADSGVNRLERASADQLLSREPYMGASCPTANHFACDRVGLAVWLRDPAVSVDAAIAGRELELDDPEWSDPPENGERPMFTGFLQPAGLIDGPLKVTADDGPDRWIGREPVSANVDLRIVRENGATDTTSVEVRLFAGWG